MPYVPLSLPATTVGTAISLATEQHLEQAHYLLAATYPNGGPQSHFGISAALMTLLTIAAASAIRYFNPHTNNKDHGDRAAFEECVLNFFPWDRITIEDDQHRPAQERRGVATKELYQVFRNPFVHSGGVTSKVRLADQKVEEWFRQPRVAHVFPGLASPQENEKDVEDYCHRNLSGDVLIKLEACSSTVCTRPLYWCTRKMIEAFATDTSVQRDICCRHDLQSNSR